MYIITSIKKNIIAISNKNNDIDFHNNLFNTDDCIVTRRDDPTEEELLSLQAQQEITLNLAKQKQTIIDELDLLDKKAVRAILENETDRIASIVEQKNQLRNTLSTL